MKLLDLIQKGDIVRVDFNNAQTTLCNRAEVLNIPCATGESWIFKNVESHNPTGEIYYVSEGCTVTLLNKK
jgi:hypothetical protein